MLLVLGCWMQIEDWITCNIHTSAVLEGKDKWKEPNKKKIQKVAKTYV